MPFFAKRVVELLRKKERKKAIYRPVSLLQNVQTNPVTNPGAWPLKPSLTKITPTNWLGSYFRASLPFSSQNLIMARSLTNSKPITN
jgi:hypothetical protein